MFSLCPPAIPVSLPPSEACGLQRVAAALLAASLHSGTSARCHTDHTGQLASVRRKQIAEEERGNQNSKGEIDPLETMHILILGIEHE